MGKYRLTEIEGNAVIYIETKTSAELFLWIDNNLENSSNWHINIV